MDMQDMAEIIVLREECRVLRVERDQAIEAKRVAESQVADLKSWIKCANQFMWAHEHDCPRSKSDGPCNCGLDQFLARPRPFMESYRAELRAAVDALRSFPNWTTAASIVAAYDAKHHEPSATPQLDERSALASGLPMKTRWPN